jgi:hypothetical protein
MELPDKETEKKSWIRRAIQRAFGSPQGPKQTRPRQSCGRELPYSQLESRQLLAANVTANLTSNGTLQIEGTERADNIKVFQSSAGIVVSQNGTSIARPFPTNSVRSIVAATLGGQDRIIVDIDKSLDSVSVNLGTGVNDVAIINCQRVGSVSVNAVASQDSYVKFIGTATGRVFVDYGSEASENKFELASYSGIGRLDLRMGAGQDVFGMGQNTWIGTADVRMGGGNDTFSVMFSSTIDSGTVDGGTGTDRVVGKGWLRGGVRLVSFQ